jgi:hypothetical protein
MVTYVPSARLRDMGDRCQLPVTADLTARRHVLETPWGTFYAPLDEVAS